MASAMRNAFWSISARLVADAQIVPSCVKNQFDRPVSQAVSLLSFRGLRQLIPVVAGAAEPAPAKAAQQSVQNPPAAPWTPTRNLVKRKTLPKRMGFMIEVLEKERQEAVMKAKNFPAFGPGDLLEVKLAIPENKRRIATFKGIVMAKRNRGWRTSFTLRNHVGTAGAIERTFPLYSPNLLELSVTGHRRVRRSKLYYLRERQPKEYRVT